MPFRDESHLRKLLETKRRTGEPSPSVQYSDGYGKASGSYTQKMRMALWKWMKEKYGSSVSPLAFKYKLYRRKTVVVVGTYPYIRHLPSYGRGKKGFILDLHVVSIDGIAYRGLGRRTYFAWDRIIGKEGMLALPMPKTYLNESN